MVFCEKSRLQNQHFQAHINDKPHPDGTIDKQSGNAVAAHFL